MDENTKKKTYDQIVTEAVDDIFDAFKKGTTQSEAEIKAEEQMRYLSSQFFIQVNRIAAALELLASVQASKLHRGS